MSFKKIKLSRGKYALVDSEDYDHINSFNWVYHVGQKDSYGYALGTTGKYRGKRMHRVILKAKKGDVVDHLNHNGIDNRKSNISIVTISFNNLNRRVKNSTGYKGVTKVDSTYIARITYNKKRIYLGAYKTALGARRAYLKAYKKYYGSNI